MHYFVIFTLMLCDCLGSIPQRIINRVNAEQPMMAASIRQHCERRYEINDPPINDVSHWIEKIRAVPSVFETPVIVQPLIPILTDNSNTSDNEITIDNLTHNSEEHEEKKEILENDSKAIADEELFVENTPEIIEVTQNVNPFTSAINTNNVVEASAPPLPNTVFVASTPVPDTVVKCSTPVTNSLERSNEVGDLNDGQLMLDNGFDLKVDHYSHLGPLELPSRIDNEDCLIDENESIGDISQVEVTSRNIIFI